jgi:hypothetical protein
MSQLTGQREIHRDLQVMHSTPGRIRLRARKLYGRALPAETIVRKLSGIDGMKQVEVNPTIGSLTMHYHRSALESVTFFAEVAGALGLVAEGIEPDAVESLFDLVGISPAEVAGMLDRQHIVLPVATFALGFFLGRHFI